MTRKEPMLRTLHPSLPLGAVAIGALLLAGCASPAEEAEGAADAAQESGTGEGHGAVEGAAEAAEPPLQLLSVSASGEVGTLDLLDGEAATLDAVGAPSALATDGRYAFATTDAGLEVVDSGVWTWDHVDHFHYYRAEPAAVGVVEGEGPAAVSGGALSTAGSTGVFFEGSGDAVLLDNAGLASGEIVETFRIATGEESGVVAPLGDGGVVAAGGSVRFYGADGEATGDEAACDDPSGAITTRVALVIGCADGAVLATAAGGGAAFESVAYPAGADAPRATAFDGRKGRPTVAALAGDEGFWLLDTRQQEWSLVETDEPLDAVTAVDDEDGNVVAIGADGRVRVYSATGEERAATDAIAGEGSSLVVDAQRAYVSAPADGAVYEIDYADSARIARTLETPTDPAFVVEVGR